MPGCTNTKTNKEAAKKKGNAKCDDPTKPCPHAKCCCCATSASIQNATAYNNGRHFGHKYDFVIRMDFTAGTKGTSDCTLEWWEKSNIPYAAVTKANTWMELFSSYSGSPTFDPWKNRTVHCPGGGSETVTISDPPALGIRPGRTAKRTLEFRLKVKSGSGCSCSHASRQATATQVLEIINGVPNGSGTFTTP